MPAVTTERAGDIAIVRLNRPERLNAINQDVRRELPPALAQLNSDSSVRAVVLTAAGDRAFCAGQDLEEGAGYDIGDVDRWFTEMHSMYAAVRALDGPDSCHQLPLNGNRVQDLRYRSNERGAEAVRCTVP